MPVDITLLGSTGFTGSLTANYLAQHVPATSSWAIAGRNHGKLQAQARELASAGVCEPDLVVVDTTDVDAMRELAASTRILVTTVGPYLQHGEPAVAAAAEAGIGYLDLTGEPGFVDQMWLKYHDIARATGATLVHACGFDSIPYDLGTLYTVSQLADDAPVTIKAYVRGSGGLSGGTLHSALTQFSQLRAAGRSAKQRRSRETRPAVRRVSGGGSFGRAPHDDGWAVPLPTIDPQIVLRSARALDSYGPKFRYEHFAHVKTTRMLAAGGLAIAGLGLGAQIPPVRKQLGKLRGPGDGPTPEQREKAWFRLDLIAEDDRGEQVAHTTVSGKDPGYGGTARMLSEAAMCLAYDDVPKVAGQTTTAVAMGQALIDRLNPESIKFEGRSLVG